MDNSIRRERIKQYDDCYSKNDRDSLTKLLVKSFVFTSSYSEYDDTHKITIK